VGVRLHLPSEDWSSLQARGAELRRRLLEWWERHGRHDIPWKHRADLKSATSALAGAPSMG
jgi:adenine-specific DNA glycosylase